MTITSQVTRNSFAGDGVTTDFPTTFPFFESSDLVVLELDGSSGAVTTLTEGAEYTVTGGEGSTGTVVADTAPAIGKSWVVERVTERTQQSDYEDQASVDLERLEQDFDKGVMRDQEWNRDLDRAIHFPPIDNPTEANSELPRAADRVGKILSFGASGEVQVTDPAVLDPDTVTLGGFTQTLLPLGTKSAWKTALEIVETLSGVITNIGGGTLASRPTAATHGNGLWFATDTGQFFHSDGASWTELGQLARYAAGSLPSAGDAGRAYVDLNRFYLHVDDGSNVNRVRAPLPRGTIGGLAISNAVVDSDHDIDIAPGQARVGVATDPDQDDAYLTSALTKKLDVVWADGDAAGGRASGVAILSDTLYAVHLLLNPSTGVVDAGFDTADTATNLLSDTLASGYTKFRRIGWVRTNASANILDFIQDGDVFRWPGAKVGLNGIARDYRWSIIGNNGQLETIDFVPPNVEFFGALGLASAGALAGISVVHPDTRASGVLNPGAGKPPMVWAPAATQESSTYVRVGVDASRQIRVISNDDPDLNTAEVHVHVHGWIDNRGRFA